MEKKKSDLIMNKKDKEIVSSAVTSIYKGIFKLSTPLLVEHYWAVYTELVSRKDFNSVEDLKMSLEIIKEELKNRGEK